MGSAKENGHGSKLTTSTTMWFETSLSFHVISTYLSPLRIHHLLVEPFRADVQPGSSEDTSGGSDTPKPIRNSEATSTWESDGGRGGSDDVLAIPFERNGLAKLKLWWWWWWWCWLHNVFKANQFATLPQSLHMWIGKIECLVAESLATSWFSSCGWFDFLSDAPGRISLLIHSPKINIAT